MSNEFLREVDEQLHYERMQELWQRFGGFVIGGVLLMLVAIVGWKLYVQHHENTLLTQADMFWKATTEASANQENTLLALRDEGSKGYSLLSGFKLAFATMETGDYASAAKQLEALSKKRVPQTYRDLARFYQASALRHTDKQAALALYEKLVSSESAFRISALEALAELAEVRGDTKQALDYYQTILTSGAVVPPEMLARANQQATLLRNALETRTGAHVTKLSNAQ